MALLLGAVWGAGAGGWGRCWCTRRGVGAGLPDRGRGGAGRLAAEAAGAVPSGAAVPAVERGHEPVSAASAEIHGAPTMAGPLGGAGAPAWGPGGPQPPGRRERGG